jgi:hypothetical protein
MTGFIFGVFVCVVAIIVLLVTTNKTVTFAQKIAKIKELFGI